MRRRHRDLEAPPSPPGPLARIAAAALAPLAPLRRRWPHYAWRRWKSRIMTSLTLGCVLIALYPLGSILWTCLQKGGSALSYHFVIGTEPVPCSPLSCQLGGIGPAVQGTLVLMGLAALWAVPVGILGGIYLAEYGRGILSRAVSSVMDVMSGVPSIITGVLAFSIFDIYDRTLVHSAFDGAFALGLIMLPIITRTAEESLRLVPRTLREASWALGVADHKTVTKVVLPSSTGPLVTGGILAAARVGGETAPLLFTAFGNPRFLVCTLQTILPNATGSCLSGPIGALGPLIYNDYNGGYANLTQDAWGAALFFILMMLAMGLAARLLLRDRLPGNIGIMGSLRKDSP